MALGTIHPVAANLFVIEGRWPTAAAAVYRWRDQVYLLGTGAGVEQRRSIRAVVASYGRVDELILLTSMDIREADSNDDLLTDLSARRRRHLGPRVHRTLSGSLPRVEAYESVGIEGSMLIGTRRWTGWEIGASGLQIIRLGPTEPNATATHIAEFRTLLLSGSMALGRQQPAVGVSESLRSLADSMHVISTGFGPLHDRDSFVALLPAAPGGSKLSAVEDVGRSELLAPRLGSGPRSLTAARERPSSARR